VRGVGVAVKIFVSYKSTDRHLVNQLVNDLTDMDHEVWYDQELQGGQNWWDNILENIRRSDLLVFALTPQSIDSYPCQLEYTYANALQKPILPVVLSEGINYNLLPVILQERQIVNYSKRDIDTYKKLASAIRSLPPTPPLPVPLPAPPAIPLSPLAPIRSAIDSPTLGYEQQVALVHQLKGYLNHPDYGSDARELLNRLSQHPTLFASVFREIQGVLTMPVSQPSAAPEPAEAPPVDKPAPAAMPALSDLVADLFSKKPEPAAAPTPAPEEAPAPPLPALELRPGETILKELDVSPHGGALLGLASGLFTYGLTTAATAAARKLYQRRLIVTDQRVVFMRNEHSQAETIDIPFNQIAEIKKTMKMLDPAVLIRTKAGEQHEFSIIAAGGVGFGNREELITLIQRLMSRQS